MTPAFVYVGRCPKCKVALSLMSCAVPFIPALVILMMLLLIAGLRFRT